MQPEELTKYLDREEVLSIFLSNTNIPLEYEKQLLKHIFGSFAELMSFAKMVIAVGAIIKLYNTINGDK